MGGLGGHMNHPYERMDLSFNTIADALQGVLNGNIALTEKVDGQNIFFTGGRFDDVEEGAIADVQVKVSVNPDGSVKIFDVNSDPGDIKAILARNKGQASKVGMTTEEMSDMHIEGGKVVQDYIFGEGGSVLEAVLKKIPPQVIQEVFGTYPGTYINSEIIIANKPNIIQYGKNLIVFHGLATLETTPAPMGVERGTMTPGSPDGVEGNRLFKLFVDSLPQEMIQSRSGQEFKAIGPQVLNLPITSMGNAPSADNPASPNEGGASVDLSAAYQKCQSIIQEIRDFPNIQVGEATLGQTYGINSDSKVGEYVVSFIMAKLSTLPGINVLNDNDKKLIAIFASDHDAKVTELREELGIKGTRYSAKKHGPREKFIFDLTKGANKTLTNFYKEALTPLVNITFRFGLTLLNTTESIIADDAPKIAAILRGMIKRTETEVRPGLDDAAAEKFDRQMRLLKSGVDLDTMNVSLEGAVFEYPPGSGDKIKLTGAFAPLNQIINILGFDAAAKLMKAAEEDIKDNLASQVVSETFLRKMIRKMLLAR